MAAPASATLTGAGYTLSNGVYSKTFGSITAAFTLYEGGNGTLLVTPAGDVAAADIAACVASLAAVGISTSLPVNSYPGLPPVQMVGLSAAGGLQSFGMSL